MTGRLAGEIRSVSRLRRKNFISTALKTFRFGGINMKTQRQFRQPNTPAQLLPALLALVLITCAQSSAQSPGEESVVPRLVNYSAVAKDVNGKPFKGTVGATFAVYAAEEGGAPLWIETQNIETNANGSYTVMLGATKPAGLPVDLFSSGQARWLAITFNGGAEQTRVALLSVPYALKAGDAQTLAGLPASAFVLAAPVASAAPPTVSSSASKNVAPPAGTITGTGTAGFLPDFTGTTTVGNSALFQTGASPSARVGINTNAPTTALDVHGGAAVRGTFVLPATGVATAAAGKSSQPENLAASAFNNGTNTAVNQTFQLKAEAVGNNTASTSGSLNLLFGQGTAAPVETGLSIASNGRIRFAAGQTFPGTGTGSVTSVGLAAPASDFTVGGSPVTSSGTLNLGWTVPPTSTDTANAIVKRDGSGNFSAGTITSNTLSANFINGIAVGGFAVTGAQNKFAPGQSFAGDGVYMIVGDPGCGGPYAAIGFVSLSGCTNYSLLGDGKSTFVNAPPNGEISFSIGNKEYMYEDSQGALVINSNVDGVLATSFQPGASGIIGQDDQADPETFAVWGHNTSGEGYGVVSTGSGLITGNLEVEGTITAGTKDFKIDHPLDPANKYLYHASVESSEMMNIYTGNITTNVEGEATVKMPSWFEAVNTDFRYQLTVMGQFAQAIVSQKLDNSQFVIKTNAPNVEVSWQVTAVRHDAYALAHPLVVERNKPDREVGYYMHPELYGQPEQKARMWGIAPHKMRAMEEKAKTRPDTAGSAAQPAVRASSLLMLGATPPPKTSREKR
jgi:trimeric autotransporter adhesin